MLQVQLWKKKKKRIIGYRGPEILGSSASSTQWSQIQLPWNVGFQFLFHLFHGWTFLTDTYFLSWDLPASVPVVALLHPLCVCPTEALVDSVKSSSGSRSFLLWLSRLRTWLVSMRMWIWSLALLSGLRIQHCWIQCRSQLQLWFDPWPGNFHMPQMWP